jgi:hypothetical protein
LIDAEIVKCDSSFFPTPLTLPSDPVKLSPATSSSVTPCFAVSPATVDTTIGPTAPAAGFTTPADNNRLPSNTSTTADPPLNNPPRPQRFVSPFMISLATTEYPPQNPPQKKDAAARKL